MILQLSGGNDGLNTVVPHGDDNYRDLIRAPFDALGTLTLGLTLAAYALALTTGRGHFGWLNWTLLLAFLIGVALFARVEARAASPLINISVLRDPLLRSRCMRSVSPSTPAKARLETLLTRGP